MDICLTPSYLIGQGVTSASIRSSFQTAGLVPRYDMEAGGRVKGDCMGGGLARM